jgi:membrane-associated phospholipid phosphatase
VSRAAGRPNPTDWVLVAYALLAALLLALDGRPLGDRRLALAAGHALVAGLALLLGFADRGQEGSFTRFAHRWLPLVAIAWLYGWAGEMRHLVIKHDLDGLVEGWDEALFPGHWHALGARLPLAAIELAHAVYFSYYLLLFVPALAAGRRAAAASDRYLFWLTTALTAHFAANLFFPVAGPLATRHATMPAGVVFVPLMDGFYGAFDRGGLAFPSTHVVAAMIAAWFAGREFFPRAAWAYALWFAAIAVSTVVCGYHYPVDVVAGVVTGGLFVALAGRRGRRCRTDRDVVSS